MEKTKLTLRVEKPLINTAKRYAKKHNTTVSQLVSDFMRALTQNTEPLSDTPILDELAGILPPDTTVADYRRHLREKYDG